MHTHIERHMCIDTKWSTLANLESIYSHLVFISTVSFTYYATSISHLIHLNGVLQLIQLDFFYNVTLPVLFGIIAINCIVIKCQMCNGIHRVLKFSET